jgi:N-methylhydantoinase A/oxoprolinase/acetone carboxylase beta subunit
MVVLGWLRPELFLGGKMGLREDLAREAIDTHLASKLGTSIEDAAMGVYRILVHSMVDAIEQASVRKGFDPREFVLVAEGGGGPLFAPEIAPEVGVKNVLVPSFPGITAALGLLTTDMVYEYVATSYAMASALYGDADARAALEAQFARLQAEALAQFEADDIPRDQVRLENIAEARYEGQGYELRIDVGAGTIDAAWIDAMKATFHDIHEREYSRRFEDADVQIANVRVRAVGVMPGLEAPRIASGATTPSQASLKLTADAWFRDKGELTRVPTAFYERTELLAGNVIEGPAIVTQFDSTSVVPPDFTCTVDPVGNLVITYSEAVQQAAERGH